MVNYIKIEDIEDYIKNKIINGSIWPFEVEDNKGQRYIAVKVSDNLQYNGGFFKKGIALSGDYFVKNADILKHESQELFSRKYEKTGKSDYYQMKTAIEIFGIKQDTDSLYVKSKYNNHKHNREKYIFDTIFNDLNSLNEFNNNQSDYSAILSSRRDGENIDFNAISEYGMSFLDNKLTDDGIPHLFVRLFSEEDMEKEHELDVEKLIRNDQDNLVITMSRDQEILDEALASARVNELLQKSANIDNLSLDELIIYKDQILSLGKLQYNIPGMQAKISSILASLDKVEAQVEQEREEKKDLYGHDDPVAGDRDLYEKELDELERTLI